MAVILYLHARAIIGWAARTRKKRYRAIRALRMAIALSASPKGCILHSGRGSQ